MQQLQKESNFEVNMKLLFIWADHTKWMLRTTGATATSVSGSFLTWLFVSDTENDRDSPVSHQRPLPWCRWYPPCSALGWLLCLGDKPLALSLPSRLLVFVVLESELYPVSFQTSASCSPGPNGSSCSACTASSGLDAPQQQAPGPIRRQSCPYDQLCLSPGSLLSVSKTEYFTSVNCEGVALGWECGGKHVLLISIISFLTQA